MDIYDRHRLERHARRVEELHTWRNAREHHVKSWRFSAGDGDERDLTLGDFWPEIEIPIRLSASATIPREWAGQPVELELWLGGEGFVCLSTGVEGGLDPFHRSFRVTDAARGGEPLGIQAEAVPKSMFGSQIPKPRLLRASLVVPETQVRALERDLSMIVEACAQLKGHEVVPHLLDALGLAFANLASDWPSASEVVFTRFREGYTHPLGRSIWNLPPAFVDEAVDIEWKDQDLWSLPEAPRPLEPLPGAARKAVRDTRANVAERLKEIKQ